MSALKPLKKRIKALLKIENDKWNRAEEVRATRKLVADLKPETLSSLEISGTRWKNFGFNHYECTTFSSQSSENIPFTEHTSFDLCSQSLDKQYDLVISEHVFEHLIYPYRALKNVFAMIKPGGYFLISTPFLVRIHSAHADCTRWTEQGLRHFLEEGGFPLNDIKSGAWGNRACVKADFNKFTDHRGILQPMKNEPKFPVVVWALARKPLH